MSVQQTSNIRENVIRCECGKECQTVFEAAFHENVCDLINNA